MSDVKLYVANCIVCNRAKSDHRAAAPVNPLPVPNHPWEVVGVDYVTKLPKSGKFRYSAIMIVVCHLIKMAQIIACVLLWIGRCTAGPRTDGCKKRVALASKTGGFQRRTR